MRATLAILLTLSLSACTGQSRKSSSERPGNASTVTAFPGAEGFGKHTSGGRGGKVIIVSNLSDSGPGSLREAVMLKEPRIIVFEVSGTIILASPLKITSGDLTIAGQTAPGDGICVRDYEVVVDADNVIVRYMRFRLGDKTQQENDAIKGMRRKNIIIDHCSMSWATDECASFYDNENFTLQWCIISESLNHSVHHKGDHGYGGIWGGMGASFHHNLFAHHTSRNPRFCGARYHKQPDREIVDFRNNVIYNWKSNSAYGGEEGHHNVVNNYYKAGPATNPSAKARIINPLKPYGKFYVAGNYVVNDNVVTNNNWLGGVKCDDANAVRSAEAFTATNIPEESASGAYESVLNEAGASLRRDEVDARVVSDVREGTAQYGQDKLGIIDSQEDVGGWPALRSEAPPADTDRDGMSDQWEEQQGLNVKADDAGGFNVDDKYTNIEMYLNSLVK